MMETQHFWQKTGKGESLSLETSCLDSGCIVSNSVATFRGSSATGSVRIRRHSGLTAKGSKLRDISRGISPCGAPPPFRVFEGRDRPCTGLARLALREETAVSIRSRRP
jgi:hypothetical protein